MNYQMVGGILFCMLSTTAHAMEQADSSRVQTVQKLIAQQSDLASRICTAKQRQEQRNDLQMVANALGTKILSVTTSSDEIFQGMSSNWDIAEGKLRFRILCAFSELEKQGDTTLPIEEYLKLLCLYGKKETNEERVNAIDEQIIDIIEFSSAQFDSPATIISTLESHDEPSQILKKSVKRFSQLIKIPLAVTEDSTDSHFKIMLQTLIYTYYINNIFAECLTYCKPECPPAIPKNHYDKAYAHFLTNNSKIVNLLDALQTAEATQSLHFTTITTAKGAIFLKFYPNIPVTTGFFNQIKSAWSESFKQGAKNFNALLNTNNEHEL